MQKDLWRKGMVIGIIILFIGVGVVLNIRGNIEKLSNAPDIDDGNKEIKILKWEYLFRLIKY